MTTNDLILNQLVVRSKELAIELSNEQRDGTNERMFLTCRLMDKNREAIEERLNELKYRNGHA